MGRIPRPKGVPEIATVATGDRIADPGWLVPVRVRVVSKTKAGVSDVPCFVFDPVPMTGPARPTLDLLARFVRLRHAGEETVLGFAARFGPLYLAFEPYQPFVREQLMPIAGGRPISRR